MFLSTGFQAPDDSFSIFVGISSNVATRLETLQNVNLNYFIEAET